jgi:hypothetical protein
MLYTVVDFLEDQLNEKREAEDAMVEFLVNAHRVSSDVAEMVKKINASRNHILKKVPSLLNNDQLLSRGVIKDYQDYLDKEKAKDRQKDVEHAMVREKARESRYSASNRKDREEKRPSRADWMDGVDGGRTAEEATLPSEADVARMKAASSAQRVLGADRAAGMV